MAVMDPEFWHEPRPFGVFLLGLSFLVLAVGGTITGNLYGKGGMVDRAKTPRDFWAGLAVYYLCAAGLILCWVYGTPR